MFIRQIFLCKTRISLTFCEQEKNIFVSFLEEYSVKWAGLKQIKREKKPKKSSLILARQGKVK